MAFSSAHDFIEKYKLDHNIIGQFGLGFYSAFMVAERVEAVTKSYIADEPGVTWVLRRQIQEYTLAPNDKQERGTDIVLHISEDAVEYFRSHRIEGLKKYCRFLPVSIRFGTRTETIYEGEGEDKRR